MKLITEKSHIYKKPTLFQLLSIVLIEMLFFILNDLHPSSDCKAFSINDDFFLYTSSFLQFLEAVHTHTYTHKYKYTYKYTYKCKYTHTHTRKFYLIC